jgi:hypothetical protein
MIPAITTAATTTITAEIALIITIIITIMSRILIPYGEHDMPSGKGNQGSPLTPP